MSWRVLGINNEFAVRGVRKGIRGAGDIPSDDRHPYEIRGGIGVRWF